MTEPHDELSAPEPHGGSRLDRLVGKAVPWLPPETLLPAACAVVAIGYSYLGALWLNRHGHSPALITGTREWLGKPAGIGEDFGPLGIGVLLIVAGYAMTASAHRNGLRIVAGLCWILPALWCAITLNAALIMLGADPLTQQGGSVVTAGDYAANLALGGGISGAPALVALAWPVTTGLFFGLVLLATVSLFHRLPWLAVTMQLCAIGLAIGLAATANSPSPIGADPQVPGLISAFVALPVVGELAWLTKARHLPAWLAGIFGFACVALVVLAEGLYPGLAPWWYPVTAAFAILVTILGFTARQAISDLPVVRWLASRSLPILLAIGTAGYGVLSGVAEALPLILAYPLAILATIITGEGLHRCVVCPVAGVIGRRNALAHGEVVK